MSTYVNTFGTTDSATFSPPETRVLTSTLGGTGTVTGVVAGTGLSGGTITISGTLANTGVLAVGGVSGSIVLGTNLTVSGQTLNAAGGGGTITLTGDVTGAGTASFATTLAKIDGYAVAIDATNQPSGVMPWLNSGLNLASFTTQPQLGSSSNTAGNRQGGIFFHDSSNGAPNTSHQVLLGGPFGTMSGSYTIQLPLTKGGTNSLMFYDGIDTLVFQTSNVARSLINRGTIAAVGSTSITVDMALGNFFANTMTANATLLNPTNLAAGSTAQVVVNAGTSGTLTLAFGTSYLFNAPYSNASPPPIGAGDNVITIVCKDGTNCLTAVQPGPWS